MPVSGKFNAPDYLNIKVPDNQFHLLTLVGIAFVFVSLDTENQI